MVEFYEDDEQNEIEQQEKRYIDNQIKHLRMQKIEEEKIRKRKRALIESKNKIYRSAMGMGSSAFIKQ